MNVDKVREAATELSIYEIFAGMELLRQELCNRYTKDCSRCPLTSYVCRNLYKRLLWMAEKERNE